MTYANEHFRNQNNFLDFKISFVFLCFVRIERSNNKQKHFWFILIHVESSSDQGRKLYRSMLRYNDQFFMNTS